jgi:hypothetical protein
MMEAGLLQENWSWVDQRLQVLFNAYALNDINAEDFVAAGLHPIDVEEEQQDSNLLTRKHLRPQASVVFMDTQLPSELGQKRGRDEQDQDDVPMRKKSKYQTPGKNILIPNPNQYTFVNIVSDDESDDESESDNESEIDISDDDSLAEAFENCTIHSEFSGLFPMSIDGEQEEEDLMEYQDYDSEDWEHMSLASTN